MDEQALNPEQPATSEDDGSTYFSTRKQRRTAWRVLKIGCLGSSLLMCGIISSLAVALQSGPVSLSLPFDNTVKLGSDDFVLSNYNFQDGNTYYLDLKGNGTRNILQIEYLKDANSLQLILHTSTKGERQENKLLQLNLP